MKIRSRFITKLAARIAVVMFETLFKTLRLEIHAPFDLEIYTSHDREENHISSVWHDQLLFTAFGVKSVNISALVSRHQDGAYLAEALKARGYGTVRGSSSRGAVAALKELLSTGSGGGRIVMTPDGPRGPHHELKSGIVYISSKTGMPIICTAAVCEKYWLVKGSWTNLVIPKPFTRTIIVASELISIPDELSKTELEEYRLKIQARMAELEEEAKAILSGERKTPRFMDVKHSDENTSGMPQQEVA